MATTHKQPAGIPLLGFSAFFFVSIVLAVGLIIAGPTPNYIPVLGPGTPPSDLGSVPSASPADPVYNWIAGRTEQFVLAVGSGTTWGPMPVPHDHQVRFDLRATMPVNQGMMDDALYQSDHDKAWLTFLGKPFPVSSDAAAQIGVISPNPTQCYGTSVTQTQEICSMGEGVEHARLFIRDARNPDGAPLAALGALAGVKEPLQRQTAENRVTLTFYVWGCVQNCDGGK